MSSLVLAMVAALLHPGVGRSTEGTIQVFARLEGGGSAYLLRSGDLTIAGTPRGDGRADLFAVEGERAYRWIEGDRRFAVQLLDRAVPWFAAVDVMGATRVDGEPILNRSVDRYRLTTTARHSEVVLDRETGALLRALRPGGEEAFAAEQVLTRGEATTLRDYGFEQDRRVMRGWVDGSWLERAARPTLQTYELDLTALRARSKLGKGAWIGRIAVPEGFTYLGSDYQEKAPPAPRPFAGRKPVVDRDNVPEDLQIELELVDDSLMISLRQGDRMNAKVRTVPPWLGTGDFAVSTGEWTIHGALYLDPAGELHLATGPTAEAARAQADQSYERIGQASAFLRSDWMNAKTGDTLTLAISRSDNWPSRLKANLPAVQDVRADDGVWQGFEFDGWRLVARRQFDRTVVVAGSGRTLHELARLGASVDRSEPLERGAPIGTPRG
ncbi:MAG: hypothetical protein KIS66_03425 [Fimbriimonadaceae bacterium]|nr:hypothetical protein [Fimbriimonadaceae bacterium]